MGILLNGVGDIGAAAGGIHLYLCIYMHILTTEPPPHSAIEGSKMMLLVCLCSRECSVCLPVVCVAGDAYMCICMCICMFCVRVPAGNTPSASLLVGCGDMELRQLCSSCAVGPDMIYFPLPLKYAYISVS